MIKRILDLKPKELAHLKGPEIIESIKASEGRAMVSEVISPAMPLLYDVSNVELAASMGADIIILNVYDVLNPKVFGFENNDEKLIHTIRDKVGRIVGINLEPISDEKLLETKIEIDAGRKATKENALKALDQGAQMILLTGNPKTGVSNQAIIKALTSIKNVTNNQLVLAAGKMHGSGLDIKDFLSTDDIDAFIDAGADIILLPAPGTVPGITEDWCQKRISHIKKKGKLSLTSIGTSQEGASKSVIEQFALMSKKAGTDMHHIGDCGYFGIALPENIMTYSIAIRGVRHTYRRMAMK